MERGPHRAIPFAVLGAAAALVTIALFALPESLVGQMRRHRPLDTSQAGWAYRLLFLAALGQAAYAGFVLLSADRVGRARREDVRLRRGALDEVVASVARYAAGMAGLTLAYAVAAFVATGQRGGYWLFVALLAVQGAWYYHEVGVVAAWLGRQPDPPEEDAPPARWRREPPDYCPPIARGLTTRQ